MGEHHRVDQAVLSSLGGAELEQRWDDASLAAALLRLPAGRTLLAIERTYREGLCVLFDPSDSEAARAGRLWELWNSPRARRLSGIV